MRMGNVQRALHDATGGRTSVLDSATMPKHAGQARVEWLECVYCRGIRIEDS